MSERSPISIASPKSPHYNRLKYFNSLKKLQHHQEGDTRKSFLQMPKHLMHPEYFILNYKPNKKQSSLVTIFSIWNTMVGSSLLTLPWAFAHAGILVGVFIALACAFTSTYSCGLIIRNGKGEDDFADAAFKIVGKWGWFLTILSSVLLMLGATLGYYQLLTQTLYPCIQGIINFAQKTNTEADIHSIAFDRFSLAYVCIGISVVLFFVFLKRDFSFFVKINTFGVFFVLMILLFNYSYAFYGFSNTDYDVATSPSDSSATPPIGEVYLFNIDFGSLAGIFGTGFFIHNMILALLKNNEHPENNLRDMSLGFLLVLLSYVSVGILGYFAFSGSYFSTSPASIYSTQMALSMFSTTHPIAFVVRVAYFFQIFSVLPLLFSVTRTQFFGLLQREEPKGGLALILFNSLVLLFDTILGIVYPNVGSVMAYIGAFCGFVLIYVMPVVVHLHKLRKNSRLTDSLMEDFEVSSESSLKGNHKINHDIDSESEFRADRSGLLKSSNLTEERSYLSTKKEERQCLGGTYCVSVFLHSLLLLFGVLVIVFQFASLS